MDWKALGKQFLNILKKVFIRTVEEEVCHCCCEQKDKCKKSDSKENSDNP